MKTSLKTALMAMSALSIAACAGEAQEEPTQEAALEETAAAEPAGADAVDSAALAESTEAFEVCDADGNRYPSEADAEAAGLDRAEYGATFCEYAE